MVKGCGNGCMKFLLFTFNFIFVAIGIALMGLGGYILSQSKNWEEIVKAPDSGAVLVCVVGAITFLVAFFGCCGASQESHCMLTIYAVVVGVVFILEVAGAILLLVYTKEITQIVRDGVNKGFEKYHRTGKGNPIDGAVDIIQSSFECCGTYGKGFWYNEKGNEFQNKLPVSCCRKVQEYSTIGSCGATDGTYTEIPFEKPCTEAVDSFLRVFTGVLAGVLIFGAAIKIIAACFACSLANAVQY